MTSRNSIPSFGSLEHTFSFAAHPWLRDDSRRIPLDILIYKLVKLYLHATPFRRAAKKVKDSSCSFFFSFSFGFLVGN